jgi:hypothetical protein
MARAKRKSTKSTKRKSTKRKSTKSTKRKSTKSIKSAPRPPAQHVITEKISLRPTLYTQGVRDGIGLALGELTVKEIEDRVEREVPQYMHGVLTGVAYMGKRSQEPPTDDPEERKAGRFLFRVMRRFPGGLHGKTKDYLEQQCMQRFSVGGRPFERVRDWAIQRTLAYEYAKRGPKGPMKRPRRR